MSGNPHVFVNYAASHLLLSGGMVMASAFFAEQTSMNAAEAKKLIY